MPGIGFMEQSNGIVTMPITVNSATGKTSTGSIEIRALNSKQRFVSAAKVFAGWFLLACLAVAVPILHFLLVPLVLLIGSVHAFFQYRVKSAILRGIGECPECTSKFSIAARVYGDNFDELCDGCHRSLMIKVDSTPAEPQVAA